MSRYRIDLSVSEYGTYYHVRKALGIWPFSNWSWSPVFTSTSVLRAEEWIEHAKFTESKEGKRIAREKENASLQKRKEWEDRKVELESKGWYWVPSCMWFINDKGDVLVA